MWVSIVKGRQILESPERSWPWTMWKTVEDKEGERGEPDAAAMSWKIPKGVGNQMAGIYI